jgi:hypothetical protein
VIAMPGDAERATRPEDLSRLIVERLRSGDLALTSTRLANGTVTVEVARRQPDGTWLWVIDQPNVTP